MSRFRRRPSPALIVASIALLMALGGTGYAAIVLPPNSVGPKQLRSNAVVATKINKDALRTRHFKPGVLRTVVKRDKVKVIGPRGAVGPAGPSGPQGSAGPQGPPGVSGLEVVTVSTPSDSQNEKLEFARCPEGKKVIGGGVRVSGPAETFVAVTRSHSLDTRTWEAQAHEHTPTTSEWTLTVQALCASVS